MGAHAALVGLRVATVAKVNGFLGRRGVTLHEQGSPVQADRHAALPGLNLPFLDRPVDLWDERSRVGFEAAYRDGELHRVLSGLLTNRAERFVLRINADLASLPWEGFQLYLAPDDREKFTPIRMVEPDAPFAFASPSSPMTVLVLIGDPGPQYEFDPARVKDLFEDIFLATDATTRSRLGAEPASILILGAGNREELAAIARTTRPNVVIFFGHGRISTQPELRDGSGPEDWIGVAALADELFGEARDKPIYWIFWACSLAEDSAQPTLKLDGPQLIASLSSRGAVSALAMRSRIRVPFARTMLRAMIQALASGEPLEVAAALARSAACATDAARLSGGQMDFAAPAVWSISEPVGEVTWGGAAPFPPSWVVRPLLAGIEGKLDELGSGVAPVAQWSGEAAEAWSGVPRLFLRADSAAHDFGDGLFVARFLSVAAAIRHRTGKAVLPIELGPGPDFDRRLMAWAGETHRHLDPRHADRELARAIANMAGSGAHGLESLLAIPQTVLMLSQPPDRDEHWRLFDGMADGVSAVIVGTDLPAHLAGWQTDQWREDAMSDEALANHFRSWSRALQEAATLLAVLNRPAAMDEVARLVGVDRLALAPVEALTVTVGGRRVLGRRAKRRVLLEASEELKLEGHGRCIDLLSDSTPYRDFAALLEVVQHQLAMGAVADAAAIANTAYAEVGWNWSTLQLRQLAGLAGSSGSLLNGIGDDLLLASARACSALQDTELARALLEAKSPRRPALQASRHAMLSEAYKGTTSSGLARARMRQHAESAVKSIDEALQTEPGNVDMQIDRLGYRQNLARILQYFDHAHGEALQAYDEVLAELARWPAQDPRTARLEVAVCRNAAECLFDPVAKPVPAEVRERAEVLLHRGFEAASGLVELWAELTYTRARLLEASSDVAASIVELQRIVAKPGIDRYPVIAVVARNRLFWRRLEHGNQPFMLEDLRSVLRSLDLLSWNAWAARAGLRSRLRAAKRLLDDGREAPAAQAKRLLDEGLHAFRRWVALSSETDRLRWMQFHAGRHLVARREGATPWEDAKELSWVEEWLVSMGDPTPGQIWNEVD